MSADGCVNHIAVSIQPSRSDREVLFLNKTVVELLSCVHVDGIGFRNHDDSAGVAIADAQCPDEWGLQRPKVTGTESQGGSGFPSSSLAG